MWVVVSKQPRVGMLFCKTTTRLSTFERYMERNVLQEGESAVQHLRLRSLITAALQGTALELHDRRADESQR